MRRLFRSTLFWTIVAAAVSAGGTFIVMRVTGFNNISGDTPGDRLKTVAAALAELGVTWPIIVAIGVWAVYSIYWSVMARGAADPQQAESSWSRGVHVTLTTLAQLLVLFPVPGLRARVLPASPWVTAAGFVVMAAGLALAVWARQVLGRFWSGAIATNAGHQLVRSGPYHWVRNPIYTALLALYLGTAIVSGELHGLLGIVIAVVAYWRKVRLEGAHLAALFGPEYEAYRRESGALIPRVF